MPRPHASALSSVLLVLVATGCFTAPTISGTTQEVLATFEIVDAAPDDGIDQTYAVGDMLPAWSIQTTWYDDDFLTINCTLTYEVAASALTLDDTGSDGIVEAGELVHRTISLTEGDATLDCDNVDAVTITGENTQNILEAVEGMYDLGLVPVSVWVGGKQTSTGSLELVEN